MPPKKWQKTSHIVWATGSQDPPAPLTHEFHNNFHYFLALKMDVFFYNFQECMIAR